ncbi:DUF6894 family protein [Sphingomonas sp.]|uniref:DUF6894 family protein n=1 Tax=Sphingomonas sp. TaxID=28214 RepID=UPI003B3A51E5
MSRYFVTLGRDAAPAPDMVDGGIVRNCYATARDEAIRSLGEALRDDPALLDRGMLQLDMVDEAGALLFRITLKANETSPEGSAATPH